MKTKSTSLEILIIVSMVLPIIYLAFVWNRLPAEIAVHYDLHGNPNGWQTKETAGLLVGSMSVLLYLVLRFIPQLDPERQLQTANYQKLQFVVSLFWAVIMVGLFYMAGHVGDGQEATTILMVAIGMMLAGMGNYMTTVKPNWFVGIRTPWTLGSEVVWRKTHRLGGRLMVAGGLLSVILAFVLPNSYVVSSVLSVIIISVFVPVFYSYIYFRKEKAHQLN